MPWIACGRRPLTSFSTRAMARTAGGRLVARSPRTRRNGSAPVPLAGVAAILARAAGQGFAWVATTPCDAPFLPLDLVRRLAEPIVFGAPAAVAAVAGGLEPLFALWPVAAAARIEAALAEHRAGPSQVLQEMGAARVSFGSSAEADPFANLNTPEELAAAESLTKARSRPERRIALWSRIDRRWAPQSGE